MVKLHFPAGWKVGVAVWLVLNTGWAELTGITGAGWSYCDSCQCSFPCCGDHQCCYGGGSISRSLGVSGRSRVPCQPGTGMERKSEITCDVKALKFQGCYHCVTLPVLTNTPPFPGTDRVPVMSFRKRYKDETYRVAQENLFVCMIYT